MTGVILFSAKSTSTLIWNWKLSDHDSQTPLTICKLCYHGTAQSGQNLYICSIQATACHQNVLRQITQRFGLFTIFWAVLNFFLPCPAIVWQCCHPLHFLLWVIIFIWFRRLRRISCKSFAFCDVAILLTSRQVNSIITATADCCTDADQVGACQKSSAVVPSWIECRLDPARRNSVILNKLKGTKVRNS